MTSSNGNIFRVTGHLCGEFTGPRWIPHTMASDAELLFFFDLHPNKRLSKQWRGWWFETLSHPLWRHRNVMRIWNAQVVFIANTECFTVWRSPTLSGLFCCKFYEVWTSINRYWLKITASQSQENVRHLCFVRWRWLSAESAQVGV